MATSTQNLPATGNETNTPAPRTGHIPKKGGYYSVAPGKFEADAWKVQEEANNAGISTEIRVAEQTGAYARVIVRAWPKEGHFVEGIVHHDFDTIMNKKLMEMLKKQLAGGIIKFGANGKKKRIQVFADIAVPFIVNDEGKSMPNLTPEGTIKILDDMFQFRDISLRDATSKAMRIAQLKALNKDWRDDAEIQAEKDEVTSVSDGKDVPHVDQEVVDKQTTEESKEENKEDVKEKKGGKPTGKKKVKKVVEVPEDGLKEIFKLSGELKKSFQPVIDAGEPVPRLAVLKKADELYAKDNFELYKEIKEILEGAK